MEVPAHRNWVPNKSTLSSTSDIWNTRLEGRSEERPHGQRRICHICSNYKFVYPDRISQKKGSLSKYKKICITLTLAQSSSTSYEEIMFKAMNNINFPETSIPDVQFQRS